MMLIKDLATNGSKATCSEVPKMLRKNCLESTETSKLSLRVHESMIFELQKKMWLALGGHVGDFGNFTLRKHSF